MTIVVCVRVNDGIVLASDSATTFLNEAGSVIKVYNHADKIFNLVKQKHIGAMTYGNGAVGSASISTISKDLRRIFSVSDSSVPYGIDLNSYTIQDVAGKALAFFSELYQKAYPQGVNNYNMGYRVCGYSSDGLLPEAWEIGIKDNAPFGPLPLYDHANPLDFGPRWNGEGEALDRLILGVGSRFKEVLEEGGMPKPVAEATYNGIVSALRVPLHIAAMPIQDAIDLTRFLAETAAHFTRFCLRPPTVGGTIELATITKHEGFRWINRKHFYSQEFNAGG